MGILAPMLRTTGPWPRVGLTIAIAVFALAAMGIGIGSAFVILRSAR